MPPSPLPYPGSARPGPARRAPVLLPMLALLLAPVLVGGCGGGRGDLVLDDATVATAPAGTGCFPTPAGPEGPNRPTTPPAGPVDPDTPGTPLSVGGLVLDAGDCTPVDAALIEVWHAAADPTSWVAGTWAATDGVYELRTVVPGGAPQELHLAVTADGYEPLTTTVRLAGADTATDDGFDPLLLLAVAEAPDGSRAAALDLVLTPAT